MDDLYAKLSSVAVELNSASDEMSKAVGRLNAAIKLLNLGVETWHLYSPADGRSVGYAKIGGKWGLAIAETGETGLPDGTDDVEEWAFGDAPRWMRVEATDHIEGLLAKMVMRTEELTTAIVDKMAGMQALTEKLKGGSS
jgi:hypothetical protein